MAIFIELNHNLFFLKLKGLGSINIAIWPEIFDIMKTLKSSLKLIYNPVRDVNFMFW